MEGLGGGEAQGVADPPKELFQSLSTCACSGNRPCLERKAYFRTRGRLFRDFYSWKITSGKSWANTLNILFKLCKGLLQFFL
jgi:hypothetical protein